jgi:hypothetical protein
MFVRKHIGLVLWLAVLLLPLSAVADGLFATPDWSGYTSRYAPGVFADVIAVKQLNGWGNLPEVVTGFDGYMALETCRYDGQVVWARPGPGRHWESFLVVDCSGSGATSEWMRRNNIVAEIDHDSFMRWYEEGWHTEKGMPIEIVGPEWFYEHL